MSMQVQDRAVSSDGQNYGGLTSTTDTTADPVTGGSTRRSSTRTWSGRSPGTTLVGLLAGVVVVLLGFDFAFHAAGASDVGFGAFIFSVGRFLAAPFAGIFKTAYTAQGTLIVWADLLAIAVYAIVAVILVKLVAMVSTSSAKRST